MKFHFRGLVKNRKRSAFVFLLVSIITLLFFQNCGFQVFDPPDRSVASDQAVPEGQPRGEADDLDLTKLGKAWKDHRIHTVPTFDQPLGDFYDMARQVKIGTLSGDLYVFSGSQYRGPWSISRINPTTGEEKILVTWKDHPEYLWADFEPAEESGVLVLALVPDLKLQSFFGGELLLVPIQGDKESTRVVTNLHSSMLSVDGQRLTYATVNEGEKKLHFATRLITESESLSLGVLDWEPNKDDYYKNLKMDPDNPLVRSASISSNLPFFYFGEPARNLVLFGKGAPDHFPKTIANTWHSPSLNYFAQGFQTPGLNRMLILEIYDDSPIQEFETFVDKNGTLRKGRHIFSKELDKVFSLDQGGMLSIYSANAADVTRPGFSGYKFIMSSQNQKWVLLADPNNEKGVVLNLENHEFKELTHRVFRFVEYGVHGLSNNGQYLLVSPDTRQKGFYGNQDGLPTPVTSLNVSTGEEILLSKKNNIWDVRRFVEFLELDGKVFFYDDWGLVTSSFDGKFYSRLSESYPDEASFVSPLVTPVSAGKAIEIKGNWGQKLPVIWSEKHKRLIFSPYTKLNFGEWLETYFRDLRSVSLEGGNEKILSKQMVKAGGLYNEPFEIDFLSKLILMPSLSKHARQDSLIQTLAFGTLVGGDTKLISPPPGYKEVYRSFGRSSGQLVRLENGEVLAAASFYPEGSGNIRASLTNLMTSETRFFSEDSYEVKSKDDRWMIFGRPSVIPTENWGQGMPKPYTGSVRLPGSCFGCYNTGFTNFLGEFTKHDKVIFYGTGPTGKSDYGDNQVFLSDLSQNSPVPIALNIFWAELLEDQRTLIGNENGPSAELSSIVSIDTEDLTKRKTISTGHMVMPLPGGRYVLGTEGNFSRRASNSLFVVDIETSEKVDIMPKSGSVLGADGEVGTSTIKYSKSGGGFFYYQFTPKGKSKCDSSGLVIVSVDGKSKVEVPGATQEQCQRTRYEVGNQGQTYFRIEGRRISVGHSAESWKERILIEGDLKTQISYVELSSDENVLVFTLMDSKTHRFFAYNMKLDSLVEFADPIPIARIISKITVGGPNNDVFIQAEGAEAFINEVFKFSPKF